MKRDGEVRKLYAEGPEASELNKVSDRPSPLLGWPGAVEAGWPDEGVAAHYGDPMREQRALATSAGLVDLSNRGVLKITGQDRLGWLHSLTTQHLERLAAGQGALLAKRVTVVSGDALIRPAGLDRSRQDVQQFARLRAAHWAAARQSWQRPKTVR